MFINGVGVTSCMSEIWKLVCRAMLPQYGVVRDVGAGSRGAYGLAVIVEALNKAVCVANQSGKSPDFAFFPYYGRYDLSGLAGRTSGVRDWRFRNAYDSTVIIHGAGFALLC